MIITPMTAEHTESVLSMMREFYTTPALWTNGSQEIFFRDVENCVNDSPYLEGYVFMEDDKIIGYAMAAKSFSTEFGKPCIWIEDLYFLPAYRGRGGGTRFLQYMSDKYRDAILRLEVEKENKIAVHVYEKTGFVRMPYLEMMKENQ